MVRCLRLVTAHPLVCLNVRGSITVGKLAAFAMLEKEPHDVKPDEIKDIKINRTVAGGRSVYPKE